MRSKGKGRQEELCEDTERKKDKWKEGGGRREEGGMGFLHAVRVPCAAHVDLESLEVEVLVSVAILGELMKARGQEKEDIVVHNNDRRGWVRGMVVVMVVREDEEVRGGEGRSGRRRSSFSPAR